MTLRCAGIVAVSMLSAAGIAQTARPTGYLAPGSFDIMTILPPAPVDGDARDAADRAIFRATRPLLDTPRGAMATNDVERTPAAMLHSYACALGTELKPGDVPRTVRLIERATVDVNAQMTRAKDFYRHPRPMMTEPGAICQPRERLAKSFDYPSGHTTGGYTWALVLARLAPDRDTELLARGRAFGESRVVCGAHSFSAVQGGLFTAATTMTVVAADKAYQADAAAARAELARARRHAPKPDVARCTAEAALVAQRIY